MIQALLDGIKNNILSVYGNDSCEVSFETEEKIPTHPYFFVHWNQILIRPEVGKRSQEKLKITIQYLPSSEEPRTECMMVWEQLQESLSAIEVNQRLLQPVSYGGSTARWTSGASSSLNTSSSRLGFQVGNAGYYDTNSYVYRSYSDVASRIGLTANKLLKGNTVCGVTGTGKTPINVFTQTTEPAGKEGIWIKTGTKHSRVVTDTTYYTSDTWIDPMETDYVDIPHRTHGYAVKVSLSSEIYLFGLGDSSGAEWLTYKYSVETNTYKELRKSPIAVNVVPSVVGNDVYLFNQYTCEACKYNISTNTYTMLSRCSSNIGNAITAVGDTIYIFGGELYPEISGYRISVCCYNTKTDQYKRLKNMSYSFYGSAVTIGEIIYLVESQGILKYDPSTDEYSKLCDIRIGYGNVACTLVGTDIYIFFSSGNILKYNSVTNTCMDLGQNTVKGFNPTPILYNSKIWFMGRNGVSDKESEKILTYALKDKQYTNGDVILQRSDTTRGSYYTQFFNSDLSGTFGRMTSGFNDVAYYYNNKLYTNLETYYGNGTSWVKIK